MVQVEQYSYVAFCRRCDSAIMSSIPIVDGDMGTAASVAQCIANGDRVERVPRNQLKGVLETFGDCECGLVLAITKRDCVYCGTELVYSEQARIVYSADGDFALVVYAHIDCHESNEGAMCDISPEEIIERNPKLVRAEVAAVKRMKEVAAEQMLLLKEDSQDESW